ncbi:hypothetical protein FRB95_004034 [Tulasnella sp. JGI-2019a]|nr:hypothetical protein FRB95_004034 [Tulasnella sp. JGI-2019a]
MALLPPPSSTLPMTKYLEPCSYLRCRMSSLGFIMQTRQTRQLHEKKYGCPTGDGIISATSPLPAQKLMKSTNRRGNACS